MEFNKKFFKNNIKPIALMIGAIIVFAVLTLHALVVALDEVFHPITLNPLAAVIVGDVILHPAVEPLYTVQLWLVELIVPAPFVTNVAVIVFLVIA